MTYTFGTFAHTSLDNGGSPIAAGASGDTLTFNVRSLADASKFGTASVGAGTMFYIWWDNEILKVTNGGAGSLSWTAIRGQLGTTASAHIDGSAIRETVPGVVFSSFTQSGIVSGEIVAGDLKITGVTGATSQFRLMGANTSGAPTAGAFLANDLVLDLANHELWLCTAGGTPGTWVAMGGGGSSTLAADTDVTITSPANGQVLTYDSSAGKWKNAAASTTSAGGVYGGSILTDGFGNIVYAGGDVIDTGVRIPSSLPPNGSAGGDLSTLSSYPAPLFDLTKAHVWTGIQTAPLRDSGGQVYNVKAFGAVGDGSTDDSTAIQNAINAAMTAGGGTVYFPVPPSKYLINSQLTFPNDGASPFPAQKPIRLVGATSIMNNATPNGGVILDLRYNGSVAKIDTRGHSVLELCNLIFYDGGADTLPFLQTTQTILRVYDCSFFGTGTSQDAIILGGTSTTLDNTATSGFAGYGTIIRGSIFDKIKHAVLLQAQANAVVIRDNVIWANGGGTAAIEAAPPAGTVQGLVIDGNLVECANYTYGIKLATTVGATVVGNNFFDPGVGTTAYVRFESTVSKSCVLGGNRDPGPTTLSDAGTGNSLIF